jgi:hypothetical protein
VRNTHVGLVMERFQARPRGGGDSVVVASRLVHAC